MNMNAILSVTLKEKIRQLFLMYGKSCLPFSKYFSISIVMPNNDIHIISTNADYIIDYMESNLSEHSIILKSGTVSDKKIIPWRYGISNNHHSVINIQEEKYGFYNGMSFIRPLSQEFTAIYSLASYKQEILTLVDTFKHFDEIHALGDFLLDQFWDDIVAHIGVKIPRPNIPYRASKTILDGDLTDIINIVRNHPT